MCGFLVATIPNVFSWMNFYNLKRILMEVYVKDERTKKGFKKKFGHQYPTNTYCG